MFPRSFPSLKEASFKVAFPESFTEKIRFLVELGMASHEKIKNGVSPREMLIAVASNQDVPSDSTPRDCDVLQVIAKGIDKGSPVTSTAQSIIFPHPEWKIGAGALDTGVPLSIGAMMLARNEISEAGVLCPETSVPRKRFFDELERRCIVVKFSESI
jgi:saccharopine dehydrogenase-like NADP-dependent oxidoreductase